MSVYVVGLVFEKPAQLILNGLLMAVSSLWCLCYGVCSLEMLEILLLGTYIAVVSC